MFDELDWDYFHRISLQHRLAPFVYRCLSTAGEEAISPTALEGFKTDRESVAIRNLNMVKTLHQVFAIFEEDDIRAFPYKGPVLLDAVYDDITIRESKDLDILVPKEDVLAARDVLLENGFREKTELTDSDIRTRLRTGHHIELVSENGVFIELHWRITHRHFPYDFDFDTLWRDREFVDVEGEVLPTIPPDEELILLAVHGSRHCWEELAWICDFAGMIDVYDFAWEDLLRTASNRGAERMLLVAVELAETLTDVTSAPLLRHRIQTDPVVTALVDSVLNLFLWKAKPPRLSKIWYMYHVRERPADKIEMISRYLFLPNQSDVDRLPSSIQFYPLAVLSRPIFVTMEIGTLLRDKI